MAVNLLEEDRLVYHDLSGETFEIKVGQITLNFNTDPDLESFGVVVDRHAVETLCDALTCWLETGRLK